MKLNESLKKRNYWHSFVNLRVFLLPLATQNGWNPFSISPGLAIGKWKRSLTFGSLCFLAIWCGKTEFFVVHTMSNKKFTIETVERNGLEFLMAEFDYKYWSKEGKGKLKDDFPLSFFHGAATRVRWKQTHVLITFWHDSDFKLFSTAKSFSFRRVVFHIFTSELKCRKSNYVLSEVSLCFHYLNVVCRHFVDIPNIKSQTTVISNNENETAHKILKFWNFLSILAAEVFALVC